MDTDHRSPNVVVVIADDLAWGDIARHGNPIVRTPSLDALHDRSVRLTHPMRPGDLGDQETVVHGGGGRGQPRDHRLNLARGSEGYFDAGGSGTSRDAALFVDVGRSASPCH